MTGRSGLRCFISQALSPGPIQPAFIAVLPEINVPGTDGLELLAEIKQRFPNLPVMMVTAYGDDDRRRRARELGAFEFLPKPVDFDHLKAQLHQLPAAANWVPATSVASIAARRQVALTPPRTSPGVGRIGRTPDAPVSAIARRLARHSG